MEDRHAGGLGGDLGIVPRAAEAGETIEDFCGVAGSLDERRIVGRFSTFLEHYKQHRDGSRVTRYNALFHWRGAPGEGGGGRGCAKRITCR